MLSPRNCAVQRRTMVNGEATYYSTSPYSSTSSSGTRESQMNTPAAYSEEPNTHFPFFAEHEITSSGVNNNNNNFWRGSPSPNEYHQYQAAIQQPHPAPPTRLPGIANFMKDSQLTAKPAAYYTQDSPAMNDYRVEKVANTLIDPYVHLEQPTYADFTNAQLNHQQEIMQMNFSNSLSTSYMNVTPVPQTQHVPFNILELNLSNFTGTFNPTCDTPLPLFNSSPTHTYTPMTNFTPPPQDPLVVEPKPIKKRMAVQCHQNSICSNCKTRETTLWRRNGEGGVECNACNLYFRKNHRKRPLSLRKDGIMKRNRRPRNESPTSALRSTHARHGHAAAC